MTCALFWSCMDQWLFRNHPFNSYSHPIAHLGGVPRRNWIPQCWCSRARLSGGASPGGFHLGAQTLGRSSGTRQLRNWCKDAIEKCPHSHANLVPVPGFRRWLTTTSSYLVDPASSHMLVLKIKPCMSKYKHLYRETANGSLKQLWFIWWFLCYLDNRSNSRANTCTSRELALCTY